MNFTAKSRYALKIMIDLALHSDKGVQQREDIAVRAGIPSDFMDQITVKLKSSGLIESVRGRRGGYRLSRKVNEITAHDIFLAVEGDTLQPVACLQNDLECEKEHSCLSRFAWERIYHGMMNELKTHRLDQLIGWIGENSQPIPTSVLDGGKRECLPPRKVKLPEVRV